MKFFSSILVVGACSLLALQASARNDVGAYSIADAMGSPQAQSVLGTNIQFYFGDQSHPEVVKTFMESGVNLKTNGANKSDKEACEWVFLSAMKELHDKAQSMGANAVVNIRSNYKNNLTSSATTFQCGSGMLMSGVALKGEIVEIKK